MKDSTSTERIKHHPRFRELIRRRSRLSLGLLVAVLGPYLALMLIVAAHPQTLAQPLEPGTLINIGIVLAVGVVLLGWMCTYFYVHQANGKLETIVRQILSEAGQ